MAFISSGTMPEQAKVPRIGDPPDEPRAHFISRDDLTWTNLPISRTYENVQYQCENASYTTFRTSTNNRTSYGIHPATNASH